MRKYLLKLLKKNNKGSSLVTAIVVVAFMSILGTIALYLAGENFKMKVIDANNKNSFYEAEEVVDLFKTALIIDTATAAQAAGKGAGSQYIQVDSESMREELYLSNFQSEFTKRWNSHWDSGDAENPIDAKKAIMYYFKGADESSINYEKTTGRITFNITINGEVLSCAINEFSTQFSNAPFKLKYALEQPTSLLITSPSNPDKNTPGTYTVRSLQITVTNSKNFTSVINTSFQISPPAMNYSSDSAMYGDYGVAGSKVDEVKYTDCVLYLNWTKE